MCGTFPVCFYSLSDVSLPCFRNFTAAVFFLGGLLFFLNSLSHTQFSLLSFCYRIIYPLVQYSIPYLLLYIFSQHVITPIRTHLFSPFIIGLLWPLFCMLHWYRYSHYPYVPAPYNIQPYSILDCIFACSALYPMCLAYHHRSISVAKIQGNFDFFI